MTTTSTHLIPVTDFCRAYNIEMSMISIMHDYGLVQIVTSNNHEYIAGEQVGELEKMIRLHEELEINPEGLDAIRHLLNRMGELEAEITRLRRKVRFLKPGKTPDTREATNNLLNAACPMPKLISSKS